MGIEHSRVRNLRSSTGAWIATLGKIDGKDIENKPVKSFFKGKKYTSRNGRFIHDYVARNISEEAYKLLVEKNYIWKRYKEGLIFALQVMGEDPDVREQKEEESDEDEYSIITYTVFTFSNSNASIMFVLTKFFTRRTDKTKYRIRITTEDPEYAPDVFFTRFFDELESARLKWAAHVEERNSAYALARTGRMAAGPQQALDIFAMHQYGTSARAARGDATVSGDMEAKDYSKMYSEALSNHRLFDGGLKGGISHRANNLRQAIYNEMHILKLLNKRRQEGLIDDFQFDSGHGPFAEEVNRHVDLQAKRGIAPKDINDALERHRMEFIENFNY